MTNMFTTKRLKEIFEKDHQKELQEREEAYQVDTRWYNKFEPRSSKNSYELYRKVQSKDYTDGMECWHFYDNNEKWHILSKRDFLDQFAPYEKEVPEYRYFIEDDNGYLVTEEFYTDEEWSLKKLQKDSKFQRLDATKRIRFARC